jgi:hypothetical protein
MSLQEQARRDGHALLEDTEPRPAPQTDPTNPYRQEAAGVWVAAERAAERHQDEPGLTDLDRALRAI